MKKFKKLTVLPNKGKPSRHPSSKRLDVGKEIADLADYGNEVLPVGQNELESTLLVDQINMLPNGAKNIGQMISGSNAQEPYKYEEEVYESAQKDEELAPECSTFFGEKDNAWNDIDPSALDPVLKCI